MSDSTPREAARRNPIWMVLFVVGGLGLIANAFLREGGMANRFVEVTQFERVEASDSAGKSVWVAPDDARLASGDLTLVSGSEPIVWETRTRVSPKEADEVVAAVAEGDVAAASRVVQRDPLGTLGVWIAALLTLAAFSFLYRDNPFYKVAESVLVGVSAAYYMVNAFWSTLVPNLFAKLAPDLVRAYAIPELAQSETASTDFAIAFFPLVLGLMLLMRLAPKGGWISVWPLAFIIGTTAGLKLVASVEADLIAQSLATMKPVIAFSASTDATGAAVRSFDLGASFLAAVGVLGVLSVLTYFFFSVDHKGAVGKGARVGVWFLMVTFGSAFGLTVMGRITLLAQRLEFLFNDWLNIG